ncbi:MULTISPECIES: restriction endonuclease subunit S [Pseudomonadota]|uniref:restriction endonuclease subunit S n=1 Tax=Pseudomonadota TaxID=1224 RepID=UPI002626901D|nr:MULTISPECIES: restriction endonuclease subunit S [Pseudomonadota]
MAGEWMQCTLADACESIDYGLTAAASSERIGPKFLRITDIVAENVDWNTVPCVGADDATLAKYRLSPGDIVLARTGASTGASAYIKNPPSAVFASYLVRLKIKHRFDARFVYYYLRSTGFWTYIRGVLGDKSAQPNASASTMTKAPLRAPTEKNGQRAIAHILGTLDDKIELNRRRNATLEAMARALFKAWFVDFEPVRAKLEGRWQRGQSLPGLPAHLYDLFPDRLVDSDLGEVPEGWRMGAFADVAEHPRRTIQCEDIEPATPYIALEHMPKRSIALSDWATGDGLESNKFRFSRGEILFGKLRPYFHKVGVAPVDGVCSTDIVVIAPRAPMWFSFVLGHASSVEFVDYSNAGSTGTRMPRTSWKEMAHYELVLPPESVARAYDSFIQPVVAEIIASIHESRTLATLRDTLLPKLISGELRVPDAERFIGEVA